MGKLKDIVLGGTCVDCGKPAKIIVAGDASPMARSLAERMAGDTDGWRCEACGDAADAKEAAEETQARLVDGLRRRVEAARIPTAWKSITFEDIDRDPKRTRAIELAEHWGQRRIPGLVLWGGVGRGKSILAAAAANRFLAGHQVRWVSVSELLMDLRMPFESPEYVRAVRRLEVRSRHVGLVLDDLDKFKPSEHAVQPMFTAINGWIEAEQPLLVTLNRDLEKLAEWMPDTFGEAIASRLAGYCKIREVTGVDRRLS